MNTKDFNNALSVFIEFGPNRGIPRQKRLTECFPEFSAEVVSELINLFPTIEHAAFDIAVRHRRDEMSKTEAIEKTKQLHSLLSEDSAEKLFNQAMYFSGREGY